MQPLLEPENRIIDAAGNALEWVGRWVYADRRSTLLPPTLPATYPRYYFKHKRKAGS